MLWFALAVMTGLAVFVALWPLAAKRRALASESRETAFYRAQLAEIERDIERGQLPADEAAAARAEAGRRLLAASSGEPAARASAGPGPRRAAAVFIFVAIPLFALGSYIFYFGRPDLPDAPLAQRKIDVNTPEGLDAAIAKIESRLATHPDDSKGWAALAPVYMRVGRFDDAAKAFRQLLRLNGEDGPLRADLGEALLATADGDVSPEARAEFEKALADKPGLPKARFYLALAAEQAGDTKSALETYEALAPEAQGRQAWMQGLRARLGALKSPAGAVPGQVDASQFTPEQKQMIEGMVAQLAGRLADKGGSPDEWARLIRAYTVLHETDKAKDALASAKKALAGNASALGDLDRLASELGLAEAPAGAPQFSPEQKQMIEGMVGQLAGRLADKGGSPEEWARLIRAYSVLQETDKAKDALASARKALASNAPALGDIDQLARELGLGGGS